MALAPIANPFWSSPDFSPASEDYDNSFMPDATRSINLFFWSMAKALPIPKKVPRSEPEF